VLQSDIGTARRGSRASWNPTPCVVALGLGVAFVFLSGGQRSAAEGVPEGLLEKRSTPANRVTRLDSPTWLALRGIQRGRLPGVSTLLHRPRAGVVVEKVRAKRVIDGDTIVLEDGRKVRLVGINTPEKGESFAVEATELTRRLVLGRELSITQDAERKDRFGRSLAYVFSDEVFVNAELVGAGLAYFYEFEPNTRYSGLFLGLQAFARDSQLGLWLDRPAPDSLYFGAPNRHRFHRVDCRRVSRADLRFRWAWRAVALDAGLNPCSRCRP
jgi:micrococcal nuclease